MGVGEKCKDQVLFLTTPESFILNFIKIGPLFLLVQTGPWGYIPGGLWGGAMKMKSSIKFIYLDILNNHISIKFLNNFQDIRLCSFWFQVRWKSPPPPLVIGGEDARSNFFLDSDDFPHD